LNEDRRLAFGIVVMSSSLILSFVLGGAGFFYLLVLLDHSDYGVDAIWYLIFGIVLSLIGGLVTAGVVGLLLGQGFWHNCSTDDPEIDGAQ
jgi:hypothetical protein